MGAVTVEVTADREAPIQRDPAALARDPGRREAVHVPILLYLPAAGLLVHAAELEALDIVEIAGHIVRLQGVTKNEGATLLFCTLYSNITMIRY